ncbi:MAG: hypothetical protein QG635_804, partial [Bacteroidota bacterium]|nr:hypothetical protein [Bacteroidota bacterium]
MKKVMIFGACSAIAQKTAKLFARDGCILFLVDLNGERLEIVRDDIRARYKTEIHITECDANDFGRHSALFKAASSAMNGLDALLIAHGTLTNQAKAEKDTEYAIRELSTNFLSVVSLCNAAANYF